MRVLFIRHSMDHFHPSISHGMGIVATILESAGHHVKVIDNNSHYVHYSTKQLHAAITDFQPDVLGLNIVLFNAFKTYQFLGSLRAAFPGLLTVAGGIHMKFGFEEALQAGVDVVVNREGELVIEPLMAHLAGKSKESFRHGLETVAGVSFLRQDGSLHQATDFPVIEQLDDVPFVDYDLFNMSDYLKNGREPGLLIVNGQRGCPFKCTFCSTSEQQVDTRLASARYMFENLQKNYDKFGLQYVSIADNNFLISKKRAVEFCHRMGLDYVSCSPYRVPIARLAAAQAALKE